MKKIIIFLTALLFTLASFAQGRGINYKAVIKDDNGTILANQNLKVKFSILDSSDNIDYSETHTTTTDANGIVILIIGSGTENVTGDYFSINWPSDLYKLKVEIDPEPYGVFINMGTSTFHAVPYAYSSLDNLWQLNGDNAISLAEKVGIGTATPTELLSLKDSNSAGIKIETQNFPGSTSLKMENGDNAGQHTFFKIENIGNKLSIASNSHLNSESSYSEKFNILIDGTINTVGSINSDGFLAIQNGTSVNEFSTDATLSGNSDFALPTEKAIKTYVDSRSVFSTTSNVTSNSIGNIANDDFVFGSTQLNYNGQANRFYFDKSKGAFRAGFANSNQWDSSTSNVGDYSTAFGFVTVASGARSTALGSGTIASRFASTAIGNYNADDQNALFMVGNGTGSINRNNAFVIKDNGDAVLDGELNTTQTGTVNMIPIAMGNVNENGSIVGGTGNFTVVRTFVSNGGDDDYIYTISVSGKTLSSNNTIYNAISSKDNTVNYKNGKVEMIFSQSSPTANSNSFGFIIYQF